MLTKKTGPNLDPGGSPAVARSQQGTHCPSLMHQGQSERKLQTQGTISRCTPKSISLIVTIIVIEPIGSFLSIKFT